MKLSVASSVKKHTPMYNLTVRYSMSTGDWKTIELSAPFTRWFDAEGYFVAKPLQQWLASEVPVIGQVDPQNVVEKKEETAVVTTGVLNDAVKSRQSNASPSNKSTARHHTPGAKSRASKRNT